MPKLKMQVDKFSEITTPKEETISSDDEYTPLESVLFQTYGQPIVSDDESPATAAALPRESHTLARAAADLDDNSSNDSSEDEWISLATILKQEFGTRGISDNSGDTLRVASSFSGLLEIPEPKTFSTNSALHALYPPSTQAPQHISLDPTDSKEKFAKEEKKSKLKKICVTQPDDIVSLSSEEDTRTIKDARPITIQDPSVLPNPRSTHMTANITSFFQKTDINTELIRSHVQTIVSSLRSVQLPSSDTIKEKSKQARSFFSRFL